MKVLEVNTFDSGGGAARSMMRLLHALREEGVEAKLLCKRKDSDDAHVIGPEGNWPQAFAMARGPIDRWPVTKYRNRKHAFSPCWLWDRVDDRIEKLNPDVVHLGWLQAGFMRIENLPQIKRPVVWTTPDMWMFTGGCHVMGECRRFQLQCGDCPVLASNHDNDLSRKVFLRKQKAWKDWDFTPFAMTRWLAEMAMKSAIFEGRTVKVIPWCLDLDVFAPTSKLEARRILNLPVDQDVILYGAIAATSDKNKGYDLLVEALNELKEMNPPRPVQLVVFGSSDDPRKSELPFPVRFLGPLSDDVALRVAYCAADVMAVPSRQEGFGQTATEALACGTPVAAFAATGLLDTVVHGECGYLAEPYDPKDLAKGLFSLLNSKTSSSGLPTWGNLSEAARKRAVENWSNKRIARMYLETYQETIDRFRSKNLLAGAD